MSSLLIQLASLLIQLARTPYLDGYVFGTFALVLGTIASVGTAYFTYNLQIWKKW